MYKHIKKILAGVLTAAMITPLTIVPPAALNAQAYELLKETSFDKKLLPWQAVSQNGAYQTWDIEDGAAHMTIYYPYGEYQAQSELQFRYDGLNFQKGHQYKVSFKVRSAREGMELVSYIGHLDGPIDDVKYYFALDGRTNDMQMGPNMGGMWGDPAVLNGKDQEFSGIFTPTEDLKGVSWAFFYAYDYEGHGGNALNMDELWFDDMSIEDLTQKEAPYVPSGDVNGDGEFDIADIVSTHRWLLGKPDSELSDWEAADFTQDGKVNVFDLCLMKETYVEKVTSDYVEPDFRRNVGPRAYPIKDVINIYQGPSESYPVVARIYDGLGVEELGVMEDNNENNWFFTEYNGVFGWVRAVDEEGNSNFEFELVAKKPVIYLYPEEETDVHVELELTQGDLATTYPRYNGGWDVTASPDGTLLNKADGTHHKYLFWDATNVSTLFDMSKGFCVAGEDTEAFLKEKLTYMGLTEDEMNEFIVYWLPIMEHNPYNFIAFQGDKYTSSAKLNITPEPDSLLRVFMTYAPLDAPVDAEPQQLETFERKGFTAVEWGGSELDYYGK